jgi:hypothetical protein
MKKTYIIVLVLITAFFCHNSAYSQSFKGKYKRKIDTKLDGVVTGNMDNYGLNITSVDRNNAFSAVYWGLNNASDFKGQVYGNKIIKISQNDAAKGYFAVYAGVIADKGASFKGTWYDNRGNSGDFEFIKL